MGYVSMAYEIYCIEADAFPLAAKFSHHSADLDRAAGEIYDAACLVVAVPCRATAPGRSGFTSSSLNQSRSRQSVSTILPIWLDASIRRCASAASTSG